MEHQRCILPHGSQTNQGRAESKRLAHQVRVRNPLNELPHHFLLRLNVPAPLQIFSVPPGNAQAPPPVGVTRSVPPTAPRR